MRPLLLLLLATALAGCGLVYKLPTRQGNVIEQKQLDQLKVGMTRDQVRYLLGTPLAASPFTDTRWDYLGYYKNPRGKVASRTVSLHFEANKLARMEGIQLAAGETIDEPDLESVMKEEKKDKIDAQRAAEPDAQGGIVIEGKKPESEASEESPQDEQEKQNP